MLTSASKIANSILFLFFCHYYGKPNDQFLNMLFARLIGVHINAGNGIHFFVFGWKNVFLTLLCPPPHFWNQTYCPPLYAQYAQPSGAKLRPSLNLSLNINIPRRKRSLILMGHFQTVQHSSSTHIDYLLKTPWSSRAVRLENVTAVSGYSIHRSAGWLSSVLLH